MHRSLIIIPVILLLGLSAYTGIFLYANYSASSSQIDTKTWQNSFDGLQQALKLDPSNPEYLEKEAMLYRYKAFSFKPESEQSNEANREALARFQHLLTLRPSWAPYWGNVISIKYDLWEYDEMMVAALQNAARLGPWSKSNQHIVIRAGFHGWPFIDIETREMIKNMLDNAMQLQSRETIKLSLDKGFSDRLTPYIERDEDLQKVYDNKLKELKKRE